MARVSPVESEMLRSLARMNLSQCNTPCDAVLFSLSSRVPREVEEVLFVPPVNGQVLAYVGLDDSAANSAIFFLGDEGCVGSSLYG